jgi:hypothetical protein
MSTMPNQEFPRLQQLPTTLPVEGAVRIEIEEGVPLFRASTAVQTRIEALLAKQQQAGLSPEENKELDGYEEVDDYLSFVNRLIRNRLQSPTT